MIETLNKLAVFIRPLKWPALIIAIMLLIIAVAVILSEDSQEEDYLLIPAITGFLWFFCLYALIANFQAIPRPVESKDRFFRRIKIRLYRLWFFILGGTFILTTGLIFFLSIRLIKEMHAS
jgi:drug/metabolite transporter (DMT)-like permease